jgi:hypothetical protein
VALTAPATAATLTIADGATLTVSASATITNGTHSGTNTGDQTSVSGNAGTVTVADAASDASCWVLLGTSQTGSLAPATDSALTYNANTNALSATSFVGNASTATTATNATAVAVNDAGGDATCWVVLAPTQTGSQAMATDAGLTYNASTNTLTAAAFVGALTGNADTVTTNANLTGPVTSVGNATTLKCEIGVACSDETTALTTGTAKATFRMPYAMTLTAVRASVTTAPTGTGNLTIDINDGGTTVLSTKLTFDASEKTTTTAATPAVISDSALADDAEITIDIDAVSGTITGTGLKVWLIGTRTA